MGSAAQHQIVSEPRAGNATLLAALAAGQRRAVKCVAEGAAALEETARRAAISLRSGGRLVYAGAGSSGLLAMQDGLELPGTFGIDPAKILFVTPNPGRFGLDGASEDDELAATQAVDALALGAADSMIAVSASGATPFTVAAARRAKAAGTAVAAIVCRTHSPLAELADIAVVFDIGPEAVEGSTRLAAGTAQKAALSMISTLTAAELGYIHDGLMINLRPDNTKLRARARGIVERLAKVGAAQAEAALQASHGDVPIAIASAAGALDPAAARRLIDECDGDLAQVLARLAAPHGQSTQVRA